VEGTISLNGILLNLIDTAGIRNANDEVEKIGIEKSLKAMESSDLVILVINNNEKLTDEDKTLLKETKKYQTIIFVNKNDLDSKLELNSTDYQIVYGNTVSEDGLDNLKSKIVEMFNLENINTNDMTYLSNVRHISLIKECLNLVANLLIEIDNEIPVDILEMDLKRCYDILGEIIGKTYTDELLDELFSKFCLGK
jgi:tRNA modification GTPase